MITMLDVAMVSNVAANSFTGEEFQFDAASLLSNPFRAGSPSIAVFMCFMAFAMTSL